MAASRLCAWGVASIVVGWGVESHGKIIVQQDIGDAEEFEYESASALFGPTLPEEGIIGLVVRAQAARATPGCSGNLDECDYGCGPIKRPNITTEQPYFALIQRSPRNHRNISCSFETKVLNAQRAGYSAAIIYNDIPSEDPMMMKGDPSIVANVNISSVFVSYETGTQIISMFQPPPDDPTAGHQMRVTAALFPEEVEVASFLFTFVTVIAGTSVVFTIFLFYRRHILLSRRTRRKRMGRRQVMKLPVRSFKPEDAEETCVICLEHFKRRDSIMVLPCGHIYHKKCIVPWLTEQQRVCPICKRDPQNVNGSQTSPSERTPLLTNGSDDEGQDDLSDIESASSTTSEVYESTDSSSEE